MLAGLFVFTDLCLSVVKCNVVKEPDQMSTSESLFECTVTSDCVACYGLRCSMDVLLLCDVMLGNTCYHTMFVANILHVRTFSTYFIEQNMDLFNIL